MQLLLVWLSNPKWFTPYTSMPQAFSRGTKKLPQYFDGEGLKQGTAVRDALLNYNLLMQRDGVYIPPPKPAAAEAPAATQQGAAQP